MKSKVKHLGQGQSNTRSDLLVKVNEIQGQTFRSRSMKYKVKQLGQAEKYNR